MILRLLVWAIALLAVLWYAFVAALVVGAAFLHVRGRLGRRRGAAA